jgi:hypothetical protein
MGINEAKMFKQMIREMNDERAQLMNENAPEFEINILTGKIDMLNELIDRIYDEME